ncbi:hypothetical protein B0H17DRAFT_1147262 [Mycena rosella]|uniref:Uncharacterized protein n=1 Tax=Mycena rosella TaxID=1033263 RepID=A0AAD7CM10_MYCRO|nr:hypothetical protein B0H17DRAFT_1147262 [Mycena rosella]
MSARRTRTAADNGKVPGTRGYLGMARERAEQRGPFSPQRAASARTQPSEQNHDATVRASGDKRAPNGSALVPTARWRSAAGWGWQRLTMAMPASQRPRTTTKTRGKEEEREGKGAKKKKGKKKREKSMPKENERRDKEGGAKGKEKGEKGATGRRETTRYVVVRELGTERSLLGALDDVWVLRMRVGKNENQKTDDEREKGTRKGANRGGGGMRSRGSDAVTPPKPFVPHVRLVSEQVSVTRHSNAMKPRPW